MFGKYRRNETAVREAAASLQLVVKRLHVLYRTQ